MINLLIFVAYFIYFTIGLARIRRPDGPREIIGMVTCFLFWPIEKLVLIVITAFIKD